MLTIDELTTKLRGRGFRITPQRLGILRVLVDRGGHLSPTEIYEHSSAQLPGLTEATVYRTLDFLADEGVIYSAHVGGGRLVYEISEHNHHHLICKDCGGVVALETAIFDELCARLEEETGFVMDSSHITLFGYCPGCKTEDS